MGDINQAQVAGGKRKNGHKSNCSCHICKNMEAKAQRHGYEEDLEKEKERKMGYQKKNGHKSTCACPICKNMNNKKVTKKSASKKSASKGKKSNGHKADCGCPICKNMKKKMGGKNEIGGATDDNESKVLEEKVGTETEASDKDYKILEGVGGSRKTRRTNGHKPNCGCPICKNMKKKRSTRRRR
jgi:hypothetical protein